jgi:hypothetical protein
MRPPIMYFTKTVLVAGILSIIQSCKVNVKPVYIKDDKTSTEKEIEEFHLQLNSENYELVYNNSIQGPLNSLNKAEFTRFLKKSHDDYGDFKRIIDKRINVVIGTPIQIRAVYISQFSKIDLTEIFLYVKDGKKIKLALYQTAKGRSKFAACRK